MKNMAGGLQNFLKQANQMQTKIGKVKEQLAQMTVEGSSGGGAVTVICTGDQLITQIRINKDVVDPTDIGMLEDLVMAATNEGLKKSKELSEAEMAKITGGMSIPGLF